MAHTLIGTVTSDKRDKTITVSIVSRETHPLYRKQYSKTRKYTAHDAKNEAHVGDRVQIAMSRPISKTKAYTLVKVLEKSRGSVELKEDVNKAYEAEKVGADAEAKARRAAEKAEAEKAEAAEASASKSSDKTEVEAEKKAKAAEGEDA
ncbi:30S ribosomal protein S17 [Candidatus Saccharibacteria bacterium]|nr:30S ribosomal protein S17 [Candidatus Saccharibacteria bacterium]